MHSARCSVQYAQGFSPLHRRLRDLQLSQALVTLRRFENGNELSGRVAMMIGCRLTRRGRDGRVFRTRSGGEWKMENWSGLDSLPTAEMVSLGRGLGDSCTSQSSQYLGIFQGHRDSSRACRLWIWCQYCVFLTRFWLFFSSRLLSYATSVYAQGPWEGRLEPTE